MDVAGGGVEAGETPEAAVVREVWEETGLRSVVVRQPWQWQRPIYGDINLEHYFLMHVDAEQELVPGYDPELALDNQMLTEVAWLPLEAMHDDVQVAQVFTHVQYVVPSSVT